MGEPHSRRLFLPLRPEKLNKYRQQKLPRGIRRDVVEVNYRTVTKVLPVLRFTFLQRLNCKNSWFEFRPEGNFRNLISNKSKKKKTFKFFDSLYSLFITEGGCQKNTKRVKINAGNKFDS